MGLCTVRGVEQAIKSWHYDRRDFHAENSNRIGKQFVKKHQRFYTTEEIKELLNEEGFIQEESKIGQNESNTQFNFGLEIYENREWNAIEEKWEKDGRFVIDFVWPNHSDGYDVGKGNDWAKECFCSVQDLKKLADFICDFLKKQKPYWGTNGSTNQTKIKNKYEFNSQYVFNYNHYNQKDGRYNQKDSEIVDFKYSLTKYNFGNKNFATFKTKVLFVQKSKKIGQTIDIIMTPLQLKEFADFIYSAIKN